MLNAEVCRDGHSGSPQHRRDHSAVLIRDRQGTQEALTTEAYLFG